jgi:hypothetical protein
MIRCDPARHWYHFDPTKWFVWSLEKVGLTWDLRRTPATVICKARAAVLAEAHGASAARVKTGRAAR